MAIDLSTLTIEELNQLSFAAQARAQEVQAEQERLENEERTERETRIDGAVSRLTALLGADDEPIYDPGSGKQPTIRGMLHYTPEQFATYSGVAIQMLFQGLQELTVTTRDLAEALGEAE